MAPGRSGLDFGLGVIFGASLEAAQHSASGSSSSNAALQTDGRAHILLANAICGAPLNFPQAWARSDRTGMAFVMRGANEAYGGKSLLTLHAVVMRVGLRTRAGHVFISPGRNGIPQVSLAQHQALYTEMCDALRNQGRIIWHMGLWPRTSYAEGDSNWNFLVSLDTWLRGYAAAKGDRYIDLSVPMHLAGAPNSYAVDPGLVGADGVHPTAPGGWTQAKYIAETHFRPHFGSAWPDISGPLLDTAQNRITNPYMTGTSGTLANGATGVVPTGYWFQRNSAAYTCAAACEIVVGPDGRNRAKITITPPGVAGPTETFLFRRNPNEAGQNPGTYGGGIWEFVVGLVKNQASSSLVKVQSRIELTAAPNVETTFFNKLSTDAKNPNEAFEMRMSGNCIEYLTGSGGTSTTTALDIAVDPGGTEPVVIETTGWGFFRNDLRRNYPADILLAFDSG